MGMIYFSIRGYLPSCFGFFFIFFSKGKERHDDVSKSRTEKVIYVA